MAVRIFTSRWFGKFARDENISDEKLCQAIRAAEAGRIDANYGSGVIKQRIARPNEGKSGGYRCVVLYRRGSKAFFVYGFPKNQRANISRVEERQFKELANVTLVLSDAQLATLLETGAYKEVVCND